MSCSVASVLLARTVNSLFCRSVRILHARLQVFHQGSHVILHLQGSFTRCSCWQNWNDHCPKGRAMTVFTVPFLKAGIVAYRHARIFWKTLRFSFESVLISAGCNVNRNHIVSILKFYHQNPAKSNQWTEYLRPIYTTEKFGTGVRFSKVP